MPLVGNLRDFSLPDFLYLIDRGYKTGSLLLRRSDDQALLFFDKGKLLYATKQQRRERLGDMLVRAGKIAPQQLNQALQHQKQNGSGLPLGQILIQLGHVSRQDLQQLIQTQIEETVYSLFAWPDGEFAFEAGDRLGPDDVMVPVPLGLENLIMEGVRRVDEWGRIKEHIPNSDVVVRFIDQPAEKVRGINLTPEEWRVFAQINGRSSIKEIAARTKMGEFEISHIIYGFISAGLVEVVRRRPQPAVAGQDGQQRLGGRASTPSVPPKKSLVSRIISRIRGL